MFISFYKSVDTKGLGISLRHALEPHTVNTMNMKHSKEITELGIKNEMSKQARCRWPVDEHEV